MPFFPPPLDDRGFNDLVEEMLARIPAHTPEWTNPREGDPGRTLIELFAWLGDTLLYRANLIPERQRLVFLRLLGMQMRAATPARGLVSLAYEDDSLASAISIRPLAVIQKPMPFETLSEITVLPVSAEAYYKRPINDDEKIEMADVIAGLKRVYGVSSANPYVTTPVFPGGAYDPDGFDLTTAVDKCLWLALLAPKKELVGDVRKTLGETAKGGQQLLNIGIVPKIRLPDWSEEVVRREGIPHVWEFAGVNSKGDFEHYALQEVPIDEHIATGGMTRRGIVRLALPATPFFPTDWNKFNDVRENYRAGVGDLPPRLDAVDKAERLVGWIRLRPTVTLTTFSLSWVDINAVPIDQRQSITGRVVGQSNGASNQMMALPAAAVEPDTLNIQVEESGRGYQSWAQIDDLALAGREDAVYSLDSEAGVISFGDGIRGRVPTTEARVRVNFMRAGGGAAGNLPPGSLAEVSAQATLGGTVPKLKVRQMLPTEGGEDAETLEQAERRIPLVFRHRNRAVTAEDYQHLAAETPGVHLGRVEVLPRFRPKQRRSNVAGVVSVMILPHKEGFSAPNPRADRPTVEAVHHYLDSRRPLTTEMYVIGCEYIPIGVSVGVTLLSSADMRGTVQGLNLGGRNAVLNNIREALHRFLWPLPPGGVAGTGWALGRAVRDRELEVVVARVPGVDTVEGVNLFVRRNEDWQRVMPTPTSAATVTFQPWQLPELLSVVVAEVGIDGATGGDGAPQDLSGVPNPFAEADGIAVPVVPKVC